MECGVGTAMLPGQTDSGDRHSLSYFPHGVLIGVVDGLGHGRQAAEAAESAVNVLERHRQEHVISLLKRCHECLRHSRGAVMTMASFNFLDATLTWLGVGNVQGALYRKDPSSVPPREFPLLRPGVVGVSFERPSASTVPVSPGDILILATDGIHFSFRPAFSFAESCQSIADRILSQHWKRTDDALVLVARYEGDSR